MDEKENKTDTNHQLMYMNMKLGRIEERLESMEYIQELQAEDLRVHIRRTNILENRLLGFDERFERTMNAIERDKTDVQEQVSKANRKQTKLLVSALTIAGGLVTIVLEVIKHFWG